MRIATEDFEHCRGLIDRTWRGRWKARLECHGKVVATRRFKTSAEAERWIENRLGWLP